MSAPPTDELVTVLWLKGVPALNSQVATDLPADEESWAATGFVTVGPVVGGDPHRYLPIEAPVISIDCWWVARNSNKPPWAKANVLAQHIRAAALDHPGAMRLVTTPAVYDNAYVSSAYLMTQARKMRADEAALARYQLDLAIQWNRVPK